jgi:cytochrome c-type biogenesis protein CcmE
LALPYLGRLVKLAEVLKSSGTEYSTIMRDRKKRFVFGSLVIVAALVALVASSMQSNTLRSIPVHELRAADNSNQSFVGQRLRVVGHIGQTPVRKVPQQSSHGVVNVNHFTVVEKGATLQVEYRDALPDSFRLGGPVQIDGEYSAPGQMVADHVFTKCPSKYDTQNAQGEYSDKEYSDDKKNYETTGAAKAELPSDLMSPNSQVGGRDY